MKMVQHLEKHIKTEGLHDWSIKAKGLHDWSETVYFGSSLSSTSSASVVRSLEERYSTNVREHYCRQMNTVLTIALLRREL